jgi:hypothetical protein
MAGTSGPVAAGVHLQLLRTSSCEAASSDSTLSTGYAVEGAQGFAVDAEAPASCCSLHLLERQELCLGWAPTGGGICSRCCQPAAPGVLLVWAIGACALWYRMQTAAPVQQHSGGSWRWQTPAAASKVRMVGAQRPLCVAVALPMCAESLHSAFSTQHTAVITIKRRLFRSAFSLCCKAAVPLQRVIAELAALPYRSQSTSHLRAPTSQHQASPRAQQLERSEVGVC